MLEGAGKWWRERDWATVHRLAGASRVPSIPVSWTGVECGWFAWFGETIRHDNFANGPRLAVWASAEWWKPSCRGAATAQVTAEDDDTKH